MWSAITFNNYLIMQKLTIYQRLNRVLNGKDNDIRNYVINHDVLKDLDPASFQKEKLEAQQTLYLSNQWKRVDNELYQKAVFYEPTRIAAYYDYEAMEFTPEISAALDIFMEESTTPDESGNVLTIYSEDERIKNELENLFYQILDVNTNLAPWIRNTCKYGDNFIYHKILPDKGIIGVTQLPNIEITRTESMYPHAVGIDLANDDRENIKFYWKNKDIEFNGFEVSHFRLLGDDRRLPYGTSILEKARRIWKQLLLAEDAMLVYRITRAPERRVYKVFVGNMDDKDVDAYVDKIANTFKRSQVVNSENGTQDLRYNQMSVDQDFFVPIRDPGQTMPIETLPGASNLSEIADIEYIQQKMFAALRIPKAFLGFSDPIGDGKNLAILDVRFARAVNRIQKAVIQELNKIAIIHLFMNGYDEDITNFTLSMTSPSTQADLLKIERWQQKIVLYKDAVVDAGNGFGAMSMTLAKKQILDMSDDEIKLDIQRQAVERAAAEEIKVLSEVIKQTGVFKDLYEVYSIDPNNLNIGSQNGEGENGDSGGSAFGGGGGGSFGGGGGGSFGGEIGGAPEPGAEPGAEPGLGGETTIGGEAAPAPEVGAPEPGAEPGTEPKPEEEEKNLSESAKKLNQLLGNKNDNIFEKQRRINEGLKNLLDSIDKITNKK